MKLAEVLIREFMSWDWNSKQSWKRCSIVIPLSHVTSCQLVLRIERYKHQSEETLFWFRNHYITGDSLYLVILGSNAHALLHIFCLAVARKAQNEREDLFLKAMKNWRLLSMTRGNYLQVWVKPESWSGWVTQHKFVRVHQPGTVSIPAS